MASTPPYGGKFQGSDTEYKAYLNQINKNYIDRLVASGERQAKWGYTVGGKDIGLGGGTPAAPAAPTAAQAGAALTAKTPTPAGIPLNTKTGTGAGGRPPVGSGWMGMPRLNAPTPKPTTPAPSGWMGMPYRPDTQLNVSPTGGVRTEGDTRKKKKEDEMNAWLQSLIGGGGAAGGGGGGGTGTGSGWMGMPTLPGAPSRPTTLTPEQFDAKEFRGTGGSDYINALNFAVGRRGLPGQITPAELQFQGKANTEVEQATADAIVGRYDTAPPPPGMVMPSGFPEGGDESKYGVFLQALQQAVGGGGGPALPEQRGGGGGGEGGGYGGWGEYDLEAHPEWWKGLSAGNSEDQQFASILNAMIPSMSPEDQRTAASTLARMFPEFESYNSLTNQGMTPPVPGEVTDATTQQYETTQRAQSILEAITRMGAAGGIKTGTSSEVSPAVAWLQQIADLGKDFGISGATEMMTPTQLQALMAALDPLLAEGKGAGSKVAPYAEIARMLTDPFYSAGKVFPRTQGANGQMAFGEPNRRIF